MPSPVVEQGPKVGVGQSGRRRWAAASRRLSWIASGQKPQIASSAGPYVSSRTGTLRDRARRDQVAVEAVGRRGGAGAGEGQRRDVPLEHRPLDAVEQRVGLGRGDRRVGVEEGRLVRGPLGPDRQDDPGGGLGRGDQRVEPVVVPEQVGASAGRSDRPGRSRGGHCGQVAPAPGPRCCPCPPPPRARRAPGRSRPAATRGRSRSCRGTDSTSRRGSWSSRLKGVIVRDFRGLGDRPGFQERREVPPVPTPTHRRRGHRPEGRDRLGRDRRSRYASAHPWRRRRGEDPSSTVRRASRATNGVDASRRRPIGQIRPARKSGPGGGIGRRLSAAAQSDIVRSPNVRPGIARRPVHWECPPRGAPRLKPEVLERRPAPPDATSRRDVDVDRGCKPDGRKHPRDRTTRRTRRRARCGIARIGPVARRWTTWSKGEGHSRRRWARTGSRLWGRQTVRYRGGCF